ncbi:MAG: methionyl-tRNA formyltransferase [Oscillospiraceae bacterium]|jgi:methionyl-tRNA formyltransferase|nr:methionyl-tRNA formyltransferase [Oscillospiraceae bacterium]
MRIVFMGTPEFAVPSLRRLCADGHDVCAVFTQPDKPKNRGMKFIPTPVKAAAMELGLPVHQPESVKDPAVIDQIRALKPELLAVAAYGKLLPETLLSIPSIAAINVHSSLLPKYRGAAPINWVILNGERETGVTIQHLSRELDAGDIVLAKSTPIGETEDAGQLYTRLSELGAEALSEAVTALANGTASRTPQTGDPGPYAAMLTKEMSPVDWTRSAQEIFNQIRGLIPWPAAVTDVINGTPIKLWGAQVVEKWTDAYPGMVIAAGKQGIDIACGDGLTLRILVLQASGGKRMSAADYLLGHPIKL